MNETQRKVSGRVGKFSIFSASFVFSVTIFIRLVHSVDSTFYTRDHKRDGEGKKRPYTKIATIAQLKSFYGRAKAVIIQLLSFAPDN